VEAWWGCGEGARSACGDEGERRSGEDGCAGGPGDETSRDLAPISRRSRVDCRPGADLVNAVGVGLVGFVKRVDLVDLVDLAPLALE
jgi:hypothetical protein